MKSSWLLVAGYALLVYGFVEVLRFERRAFPPRTSPGPLRPVEPDERPAVPDVGPDVGPDAGSDVTPERTLTITGSVSDPDGQAVAGVNVSARGPSGAALTHAVIKSDAQGRFEVGPFEPGVVSVLFWLERRAPPQDGELANTIVADIEAGRRELRVVLPRGRVTSGEVRDAAGRPVANVLVVALDGRGQQLTGISSDAQGRFQLFLPVDAEFLLEGRPPAPPGASREQVRPPGPEKYAHLSGVRAGARELLLRLP